MDYKKIIEKNFDEEIKTLQELIQIRSVVEDKVETADGQVYPFGQGVQNAFEYTLAKAEEMGFVTKNVDNYGGNIDFGEGEETIGILGHLDVVPEGSGWSHDPYAAEIADGWMYGRGTTDDKGPMVACLYAMKALKEAGYEPSKKVRMILGLDEETNWYGMDYYLEHEEAPTFGFTPDAEFPALNGEKGIVTFEHAKKFAKAPEKGLVLTSINGGLAANMVCDGAKAVVKSDDTAVYDEIKDMVKAYAEKTGYKLTAKGTGKSLEIEAVGVPAHGAHPESGLNAISIIMDFLGQLNFALDDTNEFIEFYNKYIGFEVNGESLGIGFEDEPSGKLTVNVGQIFLDKDAVRVVINVRYPVTNKEEEIYAGMEPALNKYNMGIVKRGGQAPIYMSPENPLIKTMMEVYADNTGDRTTGPQVIGGGTYARASKNIVAFGAMFPDDEDRMHQRDERVLVERVKLITEIYADIIYKLSQADFHLVEE